MEDDANLKHKESELQGDTKLVQQPRSYKEARENPPMSNYQTKQRVEKS